VADQLQHTRQVLDQVLEERGAQDAQWGDQVDYPDGTGPAWANEAGRRRHACQAAAATGECTWMHVLLEEVYEALAETDLDALERELIQVAAVAVKWVEALERRQYAAGVQEVADDDHRPDPHDDDRCGTCEGEWHDDRCARWCETGNPGHACWGCLEASL
jgi:hypothetical protein